MRWALVLIASFFLLAFGGDKVETFRIWYDCNGMILVLTDTEAWRFAYDHGYAEQCD